MRPLGERAGTPCVRPGRRLRAGDARRGRDGLAVIIELATSVGPDGRRRRPPPVRAAGDAVRSALRPRRAHARCRPTSAATTRPADRERYQTVYAREPGSVAAPTAGLHFTSGSLARLGRAGVERAEIVLHVGPGTFRPVKVDDVSDHRVDPEPFAIPAGDGARHRAGRAPRAAGSWRSAPRPTRALETASRADGGSRPGEGETDLVIVPGHRVPRRERARHELPPARARRCCCSSPPSRAASGCWPRTPRRWPRGYRFYSYGDAMLVL